MPYKIEELVELLDSCLKRSLCGSVVMNEFEELKDAEKIVLILLRRDKHEKEQLEQKPKSFNVVEYYE